jgi:hypothetical protein
MKNSTTLLFFLLLVFSCTKKEVKKEKQEVLEPILKDTIVKNGNESKEEVSKLVFTVQIAALRNSNVKFANIANVTLHQENSLTKYRLGAFETYKEAREFRLKISNEYKGAFVQALKNKVAISITEALQQ